MGCLSTTECTYPTYLLFTGARARRVLLACFLSPSLILACSGACSP